MNEVLIIDDNQSSLDLKSFLRDKGYIPIIADTIDQGLRIINESENPKIVLLNVVLSADRGWQALTRIKQEHPEVIVIVIGAGVQTARRAMSLGALEVLSHIDEKFYKELDRALREGLIGYLSKATHSQCLTIRILSLEEVKQCLN